MKTKERKQHSKKIDQLLAFALATVDFKGEYKDIPQNENYIALSDGRIWSKKRCKFLKEANHMSGYSFIGKFTIDGYKRLRLTHEVIAWTFLGPKPEGYEINHINGIKSDNSSDNLEYVTRQQNIQKGWANGQFENTRAMFKLNIGEKNGKSKLTEEDVKNIMEARENKIKIKTIAEYMGVGTSCINRIIAGTTWGHVTGIQ